MYANVGSGNATADKGMTSGYAESPNRVMNYTNRSRIGMSLKLRHRYVAFINYAVPFPFKSRTRAIFSVGALNYSNQTSCVLCIGQPNKRHTLP